MRGIALIDSIKLFGFKEAFKFWFSWSFVYPIQEFIWMNISKKPYCLKSGWHCRGAECDGEHLTKKKDILKHWEESNKEMNTVERGENEMCVYCGEEKATEEIDNPNWDKINKWAVCKTCKKVTELQRGLNLASSVEDDVMTDKIHNELLEISQKTGKQIINATISKDNGFSSVTYS